MLHYILLLIFVKRIFTLSYNFIVAVLDKMAKLQAVIRQLHSIGSDKMVIFLFGEKPSFEKEKAWTGVRQGKSGFTIRVAQEEVCGERATGQ